MAPTALRGAGGRGGGRGRGRTSTSAQRVLASTPKVPEAAPTTVTAWSPFTLFRPALFLKDASRNLREGFLLSVWARRSAEEPMPSPASELRDARRFRSSASVDALSLRPFRGPRTPNETDCPCGRLPVLLSVHVIKIFL